MTSPAGRRTQWSRWAVRRWVTGSKRPMESISSPQNSMRMGRSRPGEYTSRMPPRRANWPTPSTWSQRVYPAEVRKSASWSRWQSSPTARVRQAVRNRSGGMVRWSMPSTVATSTGQSPRSRAAKTSSRWCSHWREAAPGWNWKSREGRMGTSDPVKADRSPAVRRASPSSAQITARGRPASLWRAAARWARWTAARPERARGLLPWSRAASSRL